MYYLCESPALKRSSSNYVLVGSFKIYFANKQTYFWRLRRHVSSLA